MYRALRKGKAIRFRPPALRMVLLVSLGFGINEGQASTLSVFSSQSAFFAAAPIASTETFDEFSFSTSFTTPKVVIDQVTYFTEPCFWKRWARAGP